MKYNTYQELVDALNKLLEENRQLRKLPDEIPTEIIYYLCSKKISPKNYDFWRELYRERRRKGE